jgi:hypothetical protein
VRHALTAVLRRRPEASHETLVEHDRRLAETESLPGAGGVGSIHDMVATKEAGLAARLHYDGHERRSALVHLWPPRTTPGQAARAEAVELADLVEGPWTVTSSGGVDGEAWMRLGRDGTFRGDGGPQRIRAEMTVTTGGGRRTPTLEVATTLENRSSAGVEALLGLEWALTMLGGGSNPAAFWNLDGERVPHDSAGSRNAVSRLRSGNDYIGIEVETRVDPPADAWIAPIETISSSEAGFERVYQGSALVLVRPIALAPGERTTVTVRHVILTSRDRAEEEGL